jgi:SOS-response transcriptional repressor LexA
MFETYKNKILSFYKDQRRMPSYQEIMKMTGFKSKNAVYKLVNKLIDAGIVSKDGQGRLIPQNIGNIIRLSQTVSAGFGSAVEEDMAESLSLDLWLVNDKKSNYMVEVQGDSMKDLGIFNGDSVLVEKIPETQMKDGNIVVALMDDGYTIKTLRKKLGKKGSEMWLEPANIAYKPIYPTEDNPIQLIGVVKTVIRRI